MDKKNENKENEKKYFRATFDEYRFLSGFKSYGSIDEMVKEIVRLQNRLFSDKIICCTRFEGSKNKPQRRSECWNQKFT